MTDQAALLQPQRASPEVHRLRYFVLLVVTSAVAGAMAGVSQHLLKPAMLLLWMPSYLLWVISDLRVRRVVGGSFVFQLIISLVPLFGLLLYLVWTRRFVGFLEWVALVAALWIPGLLAAGIAHGIAQFARGERW